MREAVEFHLDGLREEGERIPPPHSYSTYLNVAAWPFLFRKMITVNLQEAKAKLNKLVELAETGEDVVLLRGSQIVARIQPLSAEDIEITPHLNDVQASRFWKEVEEQSSK